MSNVEAIKKVDVVGYLVTHKATKETRLQEKPLDDLPYNRQRFEWEPLYSASTLEALQRENGEQNDWIKTATIEITKAIGGGSEMFTQHGDDFRVDPAFVATYIQYRRERHAESTKASIKKERELLARAEAAEAEVKRLQAEIDRKSSMPGDHRYWEGRYRDEAAESERLREALKPFAEKADARKRKDILGGILFTQPHLLAARQALASAGEEHHAE